MNKTNAKTFKKNILGNERIEDIIDVSIETLRSNPRDARDL